MKKRIAAAIAAMVILLGGCQATPEEGIVTSKNDGAFESALENTAPPDMPEGQEAEGGAPAAYADSFLNAAGDVSIQLDLTEPERGAAMPVLQVRPMEITGQMAEQVAGVLFGDAPVYEYTEQMTRAEIEQAILEIRQFIGDWDTMLYYYGGDEELAQQSKADFERRIADLEKAYQTASDTVEQVPCTWEFHTPDYYMSPEMAGGYQQDGLRQIKATSSLDGVPYVLGVSENAADRVHILYVFPDERNVSGEETDGGGEEPDVEAMKDWAVAALEQMGLGQWAVTPDSVGQAGIDPLMQDRGYCQMVLTRVYDGVPASQYGTQVQDPFEQYAPSYGPEMIEMQFLNGKFRQMWYYSATQTVATVNENVELLPFATVLDKAKEQMKMVTKDWFPFEGAELRLTVDRAELSLACVPMKDSATDLYLVPAYSFFGEAEAYDENGQLVVTEYPGPDGETALEEPARQEVFLTAINALDGSVINGPQRS